MSRFRRFAIVERSPSYFLKETAILTSSNTLLQSPFFPSFPVVEEEFDHAVDLLDLFNPTPFSFDEVNAITDVIQIQEAPFRTNSLRISRRAGLDELYLEKLCDRVSDLELRFEHLLKEKARRKRIKEGKYTWRAEIESPEKDRKYKWMAEIKDGKDEETGLKKNYIWTAQIKGKKCGGYSPIDRTCKVTVSNGDSSSESEEEMEKKKKKKTKKKEKDGKAKEKGKSKGSATHVIEIDEPSDHGAIVLKEIFAKRMEKKRGKRTELSTKDAAVVIQVGFRAYMIRRSQALRALRELAIAKSKLKEIRALFNNFSYRRQLSHDAEERQRFSEKIIVLLLTVDAIEGVDVMVRSSKKLMVDELEAMLDVVDPQPHGKSWYVKRRTFDMPDGVMNKELAAGVAQVVQMLDQEASSSETFDACL